MTASTAPERLTRQTLAEQAITGLPSAAELLKQPTMSVPELAVVTGIGRNSAYALVREGKVRVLRVGTRIRVLTSSVRELLGER